MMRADGERKGRRIIKGKEELERVRERKKIKVLDNVKRVPLAV